MSAQADAVDAQAWKALYEAAVKQLQEERAGHLLCQQERDDWRELALGDERLLACYRTGRQPSGDTLDQISEAKEALGL